MAAAAKSRVAISYDSHSDTSNSADESDIEQENVSASSEEPQDDHLGGSEADVSDDEDEPSSGSGMANVMAKILGKRTKTKDVILVKAKTDREIQYTKREKLLKEEEDVPRKKIKEEDDELIKDRRNFLLERENLEKKKRWEEMGRVRPNALEKDNERKMKRIATQGVVLLFNAVKTQQKVIEGKLKEVGSSEVRRDKVMRSFKKGDFLDMLKSTTPNSTSEPKKMAQKKVAKETEDDDDSDADQPGWKILRDDFMTGGKMKDWDKECDDDDGESDEEEMDSSGDEDS